MNGTVAIQRQSSQANALIPAQSRISPSRLQAPNILLSGHEGEVHALAFSKTGSRLASASFDRTVMLWDIGIEECKSWTLRGHKNAVLDVIFARDDTRIYSCSADKETAIFDLETGTRTRRGRAHNSIVTTLAQPRRGAEIFFSGADDGVCLAWDPRSKNPVEVIETGLPVTALECSEAGDVLFTGSVDNQISAWDFRTKTVLYQLSGHMDTVLGAKLSPDGTHLLTSSLDSTLNIFDVQPFSAIPDRRVAKFSGIPQDPASRGALVRPSWSASGSHVACGAGDRSVVIFDAVKKQIAFKLPGHKGAVHACAFSPNEPIIASGSVDHLIFLGEVAL